MRVRKEGFSKPVKLTKKYGCPCVICGKDLNEAEEVIDVSYFEKVKGVSMRSFVKVHNKCISGK